MADNLIYGIDLSHHNGAVSWTKVKTAIPPVSFVYVKITQGVNGKDPLSTSHANGAMHAGIKTGYYHFASLNDNIHIAQDAAAEARWFSSIMKTLPPAQLMPALDIETNDKSLTTQQVQLWIATFLDTMHSLGHDQIMLYSYKPFLDTNLPANHPFGNLPLWLAQYRNVLSPALPQGWSKYAIWQFSDQGKVNGVSGDCDVNKADPSLLA